mgnify:FL=1
MTKVKFFSVETLSMSMGASPLTASQRKIPKTKLICILYTNVIECA